MKEIFELIRKEILAQDSRFGEELAQYTPLQWAAMLQKEMGLLSSSAMDISLYKGENATNENIQTYKNECIKVAALAITMIECLAGKKPTTFTMTIFDTINTKYVYANIGDKVMYLHDNRIGTILSENKIHFEDGATHLHWQANIHKYKIIHEIA